MRPVAERAGCALLDDALSLEHMPGRGVAVRGRPGYRRILHRPWFQLYCRVDDERRLIETARIWDARQNPANFALP